MKAEHDQWRYHASEKPRVFRAGEEIPQGWFDAPVVKGNVGVPEGAAIEFAASEALTKFDHDGDGHVGGSLPKARRRKRR